MFDVLYLNINYRVINISNDLHIHLLRNRCSDLKSKEVGAAVQVWVRVQYGDTIILKKKYRTQVQQDTSIKYIFNFIFYVLLNIHFSYNVKLGVIIDNKENLWLLNDVYKLEYKSRIKIFINFQIHYYYLEHECSLSFVKEYLISLVFKSQLCPEFFY